MRTCTQCERCSSSHALCRRRRWRGPSARRSRHSSAPACRCDLLDPDTDCVPICVRLPHDTCCDSKQSTHTRWFLSWLTVLPLTSACFCSVRLRMSLWPVTTVSRCCAARSVGATDRRGAAAAPFRGGGHLGACQPARPHHCVCRQPALRNAARGGSTAVDVAFAALLPALAEGCPVVLPATG